MPDQDYLLNQKGQFGEITPVIVCKCNRIVIVYYKGTTEHAVFQLSKDIITNAPIMCLPALPVFSVMCPVLFPSDRTFRPRKPLGTILLAIGLTLSSSRSLLFLNSVLLVGGKVIFSIFHGSLVGPQAGVRGREMLLQAFRECVQRDHKWGQVERNARRTFMALPDQEGLGRLGVLSGHLGLKTRRVTGVDLVVPSTTDTPLGRATGVNNLACYLVCGRSLPPSGLEVQITDLARRPVLNLHQPVVIHRGIPSDNSNDGRRDLLPGVELLAPGHGTQLQEPCTQKIDVERLAVELRFDSRFTLGMVVSIILLGAL